MDFFFFGISISFCSKREVWMYFCMDNEYLCCCTLFPYRGWKGGCLGTASSGQVGRVFRQLFTVYEFLYFVISISVCSTTEVWMYIWMDNQYCTYGAVLYFPIEAEREDAWVLHHPFRLAEFSVNFFYSVWIKKSKEKLYASLWIFFFVISISVYSTT